MSVISKLTAPARLALRTARDAAGTVVDLGRHALGGIVHSARPGADGPPVSPPAPRPAAAPAAPPAPAVEPDRPEQPEFQPAHLEEATPDVVYSSADEGAQDEVGATLRVSEPWSGYREMTVPDVVDRLVVADTATLAAVRLYEQTHRERKSVLRAVEEHLARAS